MRSIVFFTYDDNKLDFFFPPERKGSLLSIPNKRRRFRKEELVEREREILPKIYVCLTFSTHKVVQGTRALKSDRTPVITQGSLRRHGLRYVVIPQTSRNRRSDHHFVSSIFSSDVSRGLRHTVYLVLHLVCVFDYLRDCMPQVSSEMPFALQQPGSFGESERLLLPLPKGDRTGIACYHIINTCSCCMYYGLYMMRKHEIRPWGWGGGYPMPCAAVVV